MVVIYWIVVFCALHKFSSDPKTTIHTSAFCIGFPRNVHFIEMPWYNIYCALFGPEMRKKSCVAVPG